MFGLGVGEVVVILVVALIFIGPKKLPGLAKGLGKGVREFQNAVGGITDSIKNPSQNQNETKNIAQDDSTGSSEKAEAKDKEDKADA